MGGTKAVVFAFRAFGEPGQSAALAERTDAIAPAGKNLVRVGLVADIPDQPVARRIEKVVQRDRQFDDPETGPKMTARHRNRADRLGPQLVCDLSKLLFVEAAEVRGVLDRVEKRGGCGH